MWGKIGYVLWWWCHAGGWSLKKNMAYHWVIWLYIYIFMYICIYIYIWALDMDSCSYCPNTGSLTKLENCNQEKIRVSEPWHIITEHQKDFNNSSDSRKTLFKWKKKKKKRRKEERKKKPCQKDTIKAEFQILDYLIKSHLIKNIINNKKWNQVAITYWKHTDH